MTDSIQVHDYGAAEYDKSASDYEWHGHEIIFGMCYDYLQPHATLLDIGIGTGLSSEFYAQVGLEITGLDGSPEMLKQCRKKKFVQKLIQHDLTKFPWPVESGSFDVVLSVGVFHFIHDIQSVFKEVSRVTKSGGLFAFQFLDPNELHAKQHQEPVKQIRDGFEVIAHPLTYILAALDNHGFTKLKQVGFLAKHSPQTDEEFLCRAIIAQKSRAE
ncbi:class I SAM-dependent methyltransferase [bacterium]|nr:MAG: class I SAM-dependent methyltransferase [bacterium]